MDSSARTSHDTFHPSQSLYPDPEQVDASFWLHQDPVASIDGGVLSHLNEGFTQAHPFTADSRGDQNEKSDPATRGFDDDSDTDFLEASDDSNGGLDDVSDVDSDYINLQADIDRFKDSVRKFRAEQREDNILSESRAIGRPFEHSQSRARGRGRPRRSRGRGVFRGPRRAAEPTGDIKYRMSRANQAFIDEKYLDAMELVAEIIRINAETHEAWTLLATIFQEMGDVDKALLALIYAAHLRPKDVSQWINCARFAIEQTGDERTKYLPSAKFCYSSAIRADPRSYDARYGKAMVLREMGNVTSATAELHNVLKLQPHDPLILRQLAELYLDQENADPAIALYRDSFIFYQSQDSLNQEGLGWSDINIYVELFGYSQQYSKAIQELKSLSRWLLGRRDEAYWDTITEDDREYDLDDSRRSSIAQFSQSQHGIEKYGKSLPLELRVKLGLYRLHLGSRMEAKMHLDWLDPQNISGVNNILNYPDLFRDSGDCLSESGLHDQALIFYQALLSTDARLDPTLHLQIGKCYLQKGQHSEAKEAFHACVQLDDTDIESRVHLAKLHEELDEQDLAFFYLNEVIRLRRDQMIRPKFIPQERKNSNSASTFVPATNEWRTHHATKRIMSRGDREREEALKHEELHTLYATMCQEQLSMRAGDDVSSIRWMEAAHGLIDDFRSVKAFYPWDKYVRFLGYPATTGQSQLLTGQRSLDEQVVDMAARVTGKLGAAVGSESAVDIPTPDNYRGISFEIWLDVFLEYALCLIRYGRRQEAYEICEAAIDAVVFCHSPESLFLIHICWGACALIANDEEVCVAIARHFTKDFQFTTDTYRLFAALNRLCRSPISWYTSGPTQKFILRQIKAMDFALVGEEKRKKYLGDKISYTAQDESGRPLVNEDMDVALLMLYGHILYSGASYQYALNYFYRAHALDPKNMMIQLSLGLAYIHYGLKRQAENRQFQILQGLSFLWTYYDSRSISDNVEERQEAHYNMARAYHLLGLTHLALSFYIKVLEEIQGTQTTKEHLSLDAAYNLQSLYAMSGNIAMAQAVTERWLVI